MPARIVGISIAARFGDDAPRIIRRCAFMRENLRTILLFVTLAIVSPAYAADSVPQPAGIVGYQCRAGLQLIGKVCLSADQQHAECLFPAAAGQTPKQGTPSEVNPASCPHRPPGVAPHQAS
jgi:hypothetical protein